jgi:hypothetical protein
MLAKHLCSFAPYISSACCRTSVLCSVITSLCIINSHTDMGKGIKLVETEVSHWCFHLGGLSYEKFTFICSLTSASTFFHSLFFMPLVFLSSPWSCHWLIISHLHLQMVLSHRQTHLFIYKWFLSYIQQCVSAFKR